MFWIETVNMFGPVIFSLLVIPNIQIAHWIAPKHRADGSFSRN